MYPSFVAGRLPTGEWRHLCEPCRIGEARKVYTAAVEAGGKVGDVQYQEVTIFEVPRLSETRRFAVPAAPAEKLAEVPRQPRPQNGARKGKPVLPTAAPPEPPQAGEEDDTGI